ncbi:hypothetical protein [Aquamicrobium defluvii]|uniref:Uncharacterized protein n=1 Tax=Aquamicrobium defluvii TaxID=69279 RepID=A0A011TYY6_9HYPH|nr:hypothetical protein [Aquamicrobium defluvii]EXL09342.1 hypothetical protein BG36_22090 [Aquamicrobium defluvii]EZQ15507.1 hypothetical protein CF98_10970 [Halopseudomonas bauzanensis]TDR36179.1 hypothetical protein DES43_10678 [Aquamicrobium defluvii]
MMDTGSVIATEADIEEIAREGYDRCHPDDSFADLVHRSAFSKEDRYLLRQWLDYARVKARAAGKP